MAVEGLGTWDVEADSCDFSMNFKCMDVKVIIEK